MLNYTKLYCAITFIARYYVDVSSDKVELG
jgi:hypothetical protein